MINITEWKKGDVMKKYGDDGWCKSTRKIMKCIGKSKTMP